MIIETAILCMSTAIFFEARGESTVGQLYIANVIENRVQSKRFPNTHCEVIFAKKQFSFLNKIDKIGRASCRERV